jgi:uncharacterized membrane protein YgcG
MTGIAKTARRVAIAAAIAALALLAGCAQQQAEDKREPAKAELRVEVAAEGYDAAMSSLFVAHVTGGDGIDTYVTFGGGEQKSMELSEGDYTVEVVVPAVNSDGSTYAIGAGAAGSTVTVTLGGDSQPDDAVTEAGIRGGDAVTGDVALVTVAGADRRSAIAAAAARVSAAEPALTQEISRATANLKAGLTEEEAAEVDGAAQEAAEEAAAEVAQRSEAASSSAPVTSGASESAQPASGGASEGGSSPEGSSSEGGSSEGGSSSGGSSEHVHSWTYHEALVWDKPVKVGDYIQCSCGAQFSTEDAWGAHDKAQGPGNGHSYSVEPIYGYEQVCMQEAYYSCECGATMPA